MPMGFCAILGGTVTMVGSSPLILLNDLILASNKALPAEQQMDPWSLFSVTPIGIALVASGVLYFVLAGRFVLPGDSGATIKGIDAMQYFKDVYGLDCTIESDPMVGMSDNGSIWLGVEPKHKRFVVGRRSGWDDCELPENVHCFSKMRLSRRAASVCSQA